MPTRRDGSKEFYAALGRTIEERREAKKLTLEALGTKVGGLKRAAIWGIEKGRQHVGVYQAYLFAEALGTTIDELVKSALDVEYLPEELATIHFVEEGGDTKTELGNL